MHSCYLLGRLKGAEIVAVMVCGEPPWTMTKYGREDYVIIFERRGNSYQEALDNLRESYPHYMPELSDRFPFPM